MQRNLFYQLKILVALLSLISVSTKATCDETRDGNIVSNEHGDERLKLVVHDKVEYHLRRMQRHMDLLNSFSVQVELAQDVVIGNQTQLGRKNLIIKFRRPNHLFLDSDGKIQFACDGNVMTLVASGKKEYLERAAPTDFKRLDQVDGFKVVTRATGRLLAPFFCANRLYESMLNGAIRTDYEAVEDGKFHKLKFYADQLEWEVFVPDETPMPQCVVSRSLSSATAESPQVVVTLRFSNWVENTKFEDGDFEIDKPLNGKAFSSISKLIASGRPQGPDPLLGNRAPRVALKALDGEIVKLTSHLNKEIVVLDFWSTSTPASQNSLPIFARIRTCFREKGVAFYAVNVREDSDSVRKYLKLANMNIDKVIMDQDGNTAQAFGISGLPQSFIIDKSGRVQVVFRGFSSDLESRFANNLNDVIEGEDVAAKTLNAHQHKSNQQESK